MRSSSRCTQRQAESLFWVLTLSASLTSGLALATTAGDGTHVPGTSGVPISHELLSALQHYPNLAGIKDSNGPADEYAAFASAFPDLNMRTGTENNLEYALEHGMGAI
jgi:hypothetical protein